MAVVWLNGPFGVGKTTAAAALSSPSVRVFDPELVGSFLIGVLQQDAQDFQSWPAWRSIVASIAGALWRHDHRTVLVPMSLLCEEYAREIFSELDRSGVPQRFVLLHASRTVVEARTRADEVEPFAARWRLDHLDAYEAALPWLRSAFTILDTTDLGPAEVAARLRPLL